MPLEPASQLAERHQLLDREVSCLGHRAVNHRRRVPLAHYEAVAVRPQRVLRVVPHDAEIERRRDLDGGQRPAGMPGIGGGRHLHDVAPDTPGDGLQFVDGNGLRAGQTLLLLRALYRTATRCRKAGRFRFHSKDRGCSHRRSTSSLRSGQAFGNRPGQSGSRNAPKKATLHIDSRYSQAYCKATTEREFPVVKPRWLLAGAIVVASPRGEEEVVQQVDSPTPTATAATSASPSPG